MQPAAASCSLVFFTFLCCVQCKWVEFVKNDTDLKNSSEGVLTSVPGWSPYGGQRSGSVQFLNTLSPVSTAGQRSGSVQFLPTTPVANALTQSQSWRPYNASLSGRRTRRQAFYNYGGGPFSWSHYFTIPPVPYINSKESAFIREENMKRLKNALEKDIGIQFLNPSGLRISIPADKINIRIVDFRFKLNEAFRGNDGGHYMPTSNKRGGLWTYDIPELKVQQGDKVYYLLSVTFKDGTDITVNGELQITRGNPHVGVSLTDPIPFRPTTPPVLPSYNGHTPTPSLGGGFGGGTGGGFTWSHQFTINANYGSGFTQSSANSWPQQADLLKNNLEKMKFKFLNPSGLTVTIPDNNINMRIEDFRLKVNEEFRGNDGGHYAPNSFKRGGLLTYNFSQVKVNQGDRIFYSIRVKLGKEEFDTIVTGVLAIAQGYSHLGVNTISVTPPPFSSPQVVNSGSGQVKWEYKFNITSTFNGGFTQDESLEVQLFKNSLENDIKFQFYNPMGLSISISGDKERVKISNFNIKHNEDFRTSELQNFSPGSHMANNTQLRDGRWNYYYPNLKVKQGDKVFYWMHVALGKQGFDNIVKGVLEIKQGDPHIGQPVQPLTGASTPTQPLPSSLPSNPYPYPSQPLLNQNNQKPSPPSQHPPPSPPYTPPYHPPSPPPYTQPPSNPSQPTMTCNPTPSTATSNGDSTPPCQGQTILDHQFNVNSLDGWTHQISIGGNNLEDEFTCFTKEQENNWVSQGMLHIKPTLLEERSNDTYVRGGELFLPGCTLSSLGSKYCHRRAQGYNILPPVSSARISTQNTFIFRYGILEIKAKLPRGDWLVPELWLEPTNPAVKEKIVLGMSTGNSDRRSNHLSAGVVRNSEERLTLTSIMGSTPWYQGFHNFRLEWTPDQVKFFVDNRQIHELPSNSFQVFSQEVYISLGVHAGCNRDFPDDLFPSKPWNITDPKRIARFWDAKQDWHPWKDPALQVDYIRVKAL